MEELVKQVLKIGETVNKVLENQIYMRNDIVKLQEGQEQMRKDIVELQEEQKQMRKDMTKMQSDQIEMQGNIVRLEKEMKEGFRKLNEKIDTGFSDISSEFRRIYYIFDKMPNHKEILKISKEYLASEN